jgi:hypothetical protein
VVQFRSQFLTEGMPKTVVRSILGLEYLHRYCYSAGLLGISFEHSGYELSGGYTLWVHYFSVTKDGELAFYRAEIRDQDGKLIGASDSLSRKQTPKCRR